MSSRPAPLTFVLVPIDQGVRNVGGRDGAREAPERLLAGLDERGLVPADASVRRVEVENTAESLESDLDRLSDSVAEALEAERLPVVLGGDHGTTYGNVRGAARALDEVGVAYLDVHLDVRDFRPRHTSGSSFRRLVEEGHVRPEHVRPLGIQPPEDPHAAPGDKEPFSALQRWASERGIRQRSLEEVRRRPAQLVREALGPGPSWCFSIDADALDERWAPGVSAPGSPRFSLEEACRAAAAARDRYRVLDVVEYAPALDEGDRTLESCLDLLETALPGER